MEQWVIKWLEKKRKWRNVPITSEAVELLPLCLLTHHFLMLPIRLLDVEPPFVGVAGVVVIEPEAITIRAESVAETDGWVGNGGVGLRT